MAIRTNLLLPDIERWPMDRPVIELREVSKSFDGEVVLDGLSLSIPTGKTTVIAGESGSGKSVLLRMMNGLTMPDEGQVLLFGEDLATCGERRRTTLRKRCTMVFQSYALIDSMTVGDNVAFALRQRELKGLSGLKGDRARAEDADTKFRSLQIGQNGDRAAGFHLKGANIIKPRFVFGVVAVAEIQAENVGAGLEQSGDHLGRRTCRAQSGDNFCVSEASHGGIIGPDAVPA